MNECKKKNKKIENKVFHHLTKRKKKRNQIVCKK